MTLILLRDLRYEPAALEMNIRSRYLAFSVIALLATSCSSGITQDDEDDDSAPELVEEIIPNGDERYLNLGSEYIFDQDRLPTFELTIPTANLASIDANPTAEVYVEAKLTFEGESIAPIGVRYKGSVGAFVGCVSGSDWANPSGRKTCTKLSMKVKINWDGSDQKFFGLKKLQFHSQNLDSSQMHDRLAYWMFREMGVPAPRAVHARLIINGEYSGLYSLVEQIDNRFAKENFDDGSGNLYKEIWPLGPDGSAHTRSSYLNALKTNEDDEQGAILMQSFGEAIASAEPDSLQEVVERWMDLDQTIAYAAVDRAIRADDGPFHWYCGPSGGCSNHNYYWYEEPSEEKLYLIPWDMDNSLENLVRNVNPVTPIADDWGETQADCRPFSYGTFGLYQRSAACDKLTATWASYDLEYKLALRRLLAGPYSPAMVNSKIESWAEQIRAATQEASYLHSDALSLGDWESAMAGLKSDLIINRARLRARSE